MGIGAGQGRGRGGGVALLLLPLAALCAGCDCAAPETGATTAAWADSPTEAAASVQLAGSAAPLEPRPPSADAAPFGDEAAWRQCVERRQRLRSQPAAPGIPATAGQRTALVGRVRGATVVFKREPRAADVPPRVVEAIAELESSGKPLRAVRDLLHRFRRHPEQLRAGLLPEGYLYVPGVEAALAVVQQVSLTRLFEAPELHLLRGGVMHTLRRERRGKRDEYVHADGQLAGDTAEILYADRVGVEEGPLWHDSIVVDFSAARAKWGFERIRTEYMTADAMAAQVRYGASLWVPVVFDVSQPSAQLSCHALSSQTLSPAVEARRAALEAARVHVRVAAAIMAEVREQLPFDSPRGGGVDAADKYPLRARWRDAYDKSLRSFRLAGRKYPVYDEAGRPLVPQVCIDFVFDTWERASGTWYQGMKRDAASGSFQPVPRRLMGGLNIDALGIDNRRRVAKFLQFAERSPQYFDVWKVPEADRVVYEERERFFAALAKHVDQFRPGDVLVVRRPKYEGRALHHNLIVMDTDLFVGIPSLLAGNAARPRIQTFEGVMQITPRRYLEYRIRPQPKWLYPAILSGSAAEH